MTVLAIGISLGLASCNNEEKQTETIQGGDVTKAGEKPQVIIEATPEMMKLYDEDIEYVETLGGKAAAEAMRNIKQLFIDNNYVISSEKDVTEYYKNVNVYSEFISTQPEEVVDRLSNLE